MSVQPGAERTVALDVRYRSDSIFHRGFVSTRRFVRRQPIGAVSAVILLVLVFTAIFADVVAPYSPIRNNVGPSLQGPSLDHLAGTDQFGRDTFSRIVHGSRVSLYVGLGATMIAAIIASFMGVASGYLGGVFDYVTQRFVDTAQAIPSLVFLIGIMVILGPSVTNVIFALAFRFGMSQSRVTRGAVIQIRNSPYMEAARAIGASHSRMMVRHLLPNIMPTVLVVVSTSVGTLIVSEAALSFLGFGVPPPYPTWGGMMSADGRGYMLIQPWMLVAPTIALSVVVFAMNMLGDTLRDELDPRLRGGK